MDEILEQLRKNAAERERLLQERDELIRRAKRDRLAPVSHLAEAAGLSRVHVHRIIAEGDSAS